MQQAKTPCLIPWLEGRLPLAWCWDSKSFLSYRPRPCPLSQAPDGSSHWSQEFVVASSPGFLPNILYQIFPMQNAFFFLSFFFWFFGKKFPFMYCLFFSNCLAFGQFRIPFFIPVISLSISMESSAVPSCFFRISS